MSRALRAAEKRRLTQSTDGKLERMEESANLEVNNKAGRIRGRKRLSLIQQFVAGILLLFVGWASWVAMNSATPSGLASSSTSLATLPSANLSLGAPAPGFTYALFDGTKVTLSGLRGKPVVLNFWASWCPPCREEAPTLEKGWEAYKGKGVQFLGVDIQDTEKDAQAFMKQFGITYPNGQDTTNGISANYGITGIPETFFINKDGKIVNHWIGPIEEKQLSSTIESMLQ